MKSIKRLLAILWTAVSLAGQVLGADAGSPGGPPPGAPPGGNQAYVLKGGDIVLVTVYQEDDMGAQARLEKDGTLLLPLVGKVQIGGRTLEQAAKTIQSLLARDYLVHPQVSVTVVEFGKRRFTILGQVQRPGSYEMPIDEPLNLLQAIAMAGGYTRIGSPRKVTLQRVAGGVTQTFRLDAEAMSEERNARPFEVQAEDTITVGEKII